MKRFREFTTKLIGRPRRHLPVPVQKADLALFRLIARWNTPLLDKTLVPLTHAANNSRLWMGIAAVLAVTRGRFGRRAALRGLLAIGLTSFLVNIPAKLIAHRHRPSEKVPKPRRLQRLPASSSFPSGHSASAAAFATAASLELPGLRGPLGSLAAAVGVSRVYTGVHYPGDVLAGAAAGFLIAKATTRLWPVAPQEPAQIRRARTRIDAEPSAEGDGLAIVVNPGAGPALSPNPTNGLKDALPKAEVIEVGEEIGFADALKKASLAKALGVSGGDGSINAGAAVAHVQNKPYVVFPGGTLNHLARDLGLGSIDDAISAVKEGKAVAVDVATIADKTFLNTASFGAYAQLVDARERLESKIGKWPAALVGMIKVLRRGDPVEVEIDGQRKRLWMIFIGNCRYEPSGFAPSWRERLDDGLLDVRLVEAEHPLARVRLIAALLTGTLARSPVYRHFVTREMHIRSLNGPLRLARDGETFDGPEEFVVKKLDKPLAIYVPADDEAATPA